MLFKQTGGCGATFVLFKFLDRDVPVSEEVIAGFQAPDVIAFVDRVRHARDSVVIDVEEKAAHGVKVAFVKDSEGHLIEVVELL